MLRDYFCQQGLSQVSLLITTNKYFNSGTSRGKGQSGATCLVSYDNSDLQCLINI